MGQGTSTSSDRVERWGALLSGTDSNGVRGKALRKSGSVNLLTGVWLHAAARAEQGMELTELERSFLAPLQEVLGEEEVRSIGRLYRKQRAEGPVAIVPDVVTSRSLQDGFGREEYKAAVDALRPQLRALPNVAIVDRAKLAAGETLGTPEFQAAMAEYRYGVMAFTGQDDGDVGTRAYAPFRARLEWDGFHCYEPVGDQWGSRDEVYWTASCNATDYKHTTRTKETGSVEGGTWFDIRGDHVTGSKVLFDTTLNGCGAAAITLWEADQSNAEWYDNLGIALKTAADLLDSYGPEGFNQLVPTPILWDGLTLTLGMFASFWEAMRNKDDLALSVGIAFGRDALAAMHRNNGRARWPFNATAKDMGAFDLYLRYTGEDPDDRPKPEPEPVKGVVALRRTTDGRTWKPGAVPPKVTTWAAPALAVFNGKLYCAVSDIDSDNLVIASLDDETWSPFTVIPSPPTPGFRGSPALAAFDGKLYCASVDATSHPCVASFDGSTWTDWTTIDSWREMRGAPALAVYDGKLHYAYTRHDDTAVKVASFDGDAWSPQPYSLPQAYTEMSPALVGFRNKAVMAVFDKRGSRLSYARYENGTWPGFTPFESSAQLLNASLAASDDRLYCVARSNTQYQPLLCSYSDDGRSWSDFQNIGATSDVAPALAVLDNTLYCAFRA